MNLSQTNQFPPFIQQEMDKILEKIRPLMKKISLYYMIGLPMLIVGALNMIMPFINPSAMFETYILPIIYALIAAIGLALFRESRFLRKQMHLIGKNYMIERVKRSQIVEEHVKKKYVERLAKPLKMDLPLFFNFLTEENRSKQTQFFG